MSKSAKRLRPEQLRAVCPEEKIVWKDSTSIPTAKGRKTIQHRAVMAMDLALGIHEAGYNIYLSGTPDLGRSFTVRSFLTPIAKKRPTPPDLLYVNNFENEDSPRLIRVPAGQGKKLKCALQALLLKLREDVRHRLDASAFSKNKNSLLAEYQRSKSSLLDEMSSIAARWGFDLEMEDAGSMTIIPVFDGKRLSDEEFAALPPHVQDGCKEKSEKVLHALSDPLRKMSALEQDSKNKEHDLLQHVVQESIKSTLLPETKKICQICSSSELKLYFEQLYDDVLSNFESFLPKEYQTLQSDAPSGGDISDRRYEINLFVDNSTGNGAPVIEDTHPTFANLLGCLERESEMGALVTDFTLIKAGSIHRAFGGYLIIHVDDIIQYPNAWDGLLRMLRSGTAQIEDPGDGMDVVRTKGIRPEPLPLDIKIILIGTDDVYETLLDRDDRFAKLFRIKAQMHETALRNAANIRIWLGNLPEIINGCSLLPFSRGALAELVDYATDLCEDQTKLSLKFPLIREIMIEASAIAVRQKLPHVSRDALCSAMAERKHRSDLLEELFMEEYDRDMIKIATSGSAVGRINGLAVTSNGDQEFGLPHQITCTVGVGHTGIIDLEREAELGGPIHTKAMMILKGYLVNQFAHNKPLVLTGNLCFEQSYSGIEGDSASGAELAVLLSAIAEVPLRLSLAFTGAVSQAGDIMPVGGVTHKIEGFFNLCARRGLTGEQGVIIPKDNIAHLMLNSQVIEAVRKNKFHIYSVTHITEALELLTGMHAGARHKNGSYSAGTLYRLVDDRLHELGWLAENAFKARRRKKQ